MMARLSVTVRIYLFLTLILGVLYPLAVTGIAQVFFAERANGGLVIRGGRLVGVRNLGQSFKAPNYFWGRPSANEYDGQNSGGSNFGPTSKALLEKMAAREKAGGPGLPPELRQASASGLDPHLSPPATLAQVERVASARKLPVERVRALVEAHVEPRVFGVLGEPVVNVFLLNLSLDDLRPNP